MVLGLCTGLSASVAQWLAIRRQVGHAWRWIPLHTLASVLAWGVLLGVLALSGSWSLAIICGGPTYGAISGLAMLWIVRGDQPERRQAGQVSTESVSSGAV